MYYPHEASIHGILKKKVLCIVSAQAAVPHQCGLLSNTETRLIAEKIKIIIHVTFVLRSVNF